MSEGSFGLVWVYVPGWVSHLEEAWDDPNMSRFLQRLASFSRLIRFDKRGTGMSDRVPDTDLPALEQRMDDVRAVMDAVGSERAAVMSHSEGGAMAMLFAATYPERTSALILHGAFARRLWAPDYPWGQSLEQRQKLYDAIERDWGRPDFFKVFNPVVARDVHRAESQARAMRRSASPGAALALTLMTTDIDLRHVLPSNRVPTLVINRQGDPIAPVEGAATSRSIFRVRASWG